MKTKTKVMTDKQEKCLFHSRKADKSMVIMEGIINVGLLIAVLLMLFLCSKVCLEMVVA